MTQKLDRSSSDSKKEKKDIVAKTVRKPNPQERNRQTNTAPIIIAQKLQH